MLEMSVSTLVYELVNQLLVGKGREDEALYFNFDARLSRYTDGKSFDASRGVHLLYHCRPQSACITVFSAVTQNCFAKLKDVTEWEHEVSHDSCWREVRAISRTYFEMAEIINQLLVEEGLETTAPINMRQHVTFPLFGPAFRWVPVKVHKPIGEYKRTVEILESS